MTDATEQSCQQCYVFLAIAESVALKGYPSDKKCHNLHLFFVCFVSPQKWLDLRQLCQIPDNFEKMPFIQSYALDVHS